MSAMMLNSASIAATAVPSETFGGRLNEIVLATSRPWWLGF